MDIFSYNRDVKLTFSLIILCAVTRVCTSTTLKCENGWTLYKDKCYYFSDIDNLKNTRQVSLKNCHEKNSYLVVVADADINNFLYDNKDDNYSYWIGLRQFAENKWGWNNGSVDDNIPWGSNQPDNNRPCARIKNKYFFDYDCTTDFQAVCERDFKPEATGKWTPHHGHWYMLTKAMSQLAAVQACKDKGGYLARLTTKSERDLSLLPKNSNVWTGITSLVWDDGTGYNWHFWRGQYTKDHPDNSGCTVLDKDHASWRIRKCDNSYYFICSREASEDAESTTSTMQTTEEIATISIRQTLIAKATTEQSSVTLILTTADMAKTGAQTSDKYKVLQYVLYVIYALVGIMLIVDAVLLCIYIQLRKSSRSQFDGKLQVSEADSAEVENNTYSEVGDAISPTEPPNAPIY